MKVKVFKKDCIDIFVVSVQGVFKMSQCSGCTQGFSVVGVYPRCLSVRGVLNTTQCSGCTQDVSVFRLYPRFLSVQGVPKMSHVQGVLKMSQFSGCTQDISGGTGKELKYVLLMKE